MPNYVLTEPGTENLVQEILKVCSEVVGLHLAVHRRSSAFLLEAEVNATPDGSMIEVGSRYSKDGCPHVIKCPPEWFEALDSDEGEEL